MSNIAVALITGGAKRIGADIVQCFHSSGYNIVLHYNQSEDEARSLAQALNTKRQNSVFLVQANLRQQHSAHMLLDKTIAMTGRLDVLINNASVFMPATLTDTTEATWDACMAVNTKPIFFLSQHSARWLRASHGCIINIADLYGVKPHAEHIVHGASKAAVIFLTSALARALAPIRVNAIAPGAILWPTTATLEEKKNILNRIPLQRIGNVYDISQAALFLATEASYMSGQTLAIDGGQCISNVTKV